MPHYHLPNINGHVQSRCINVLPTQLKYLQFNHRNLDRFCCFVQTSESFLMETQEAEAEINRPLVYRGVPRSLIPRYDETFSLAI